MNVIPDRLTHSPGEAKNLAYASLRTILIIVIPQVLVILNMSMLQVALPAIRAEFDLPPELMAWVVTSYTLPFVVSMPFYGRLGDELGKRRLFVIGIVVFLLGSTFSYLARDIYQLLLGRAVQGIGAGGFVPLAMAMITQIFPTDQHGQALATWNASGLLISVIGPLVGGLLIQNFQWRVIFLPVLVAAMVAPFIVRRQLPEIQAAVPRTSGTDFDWTGGFLLASIFAATLLFFSSESISGVANLQDWRLLGIAVLCLTAFTFWERGRQNSFVDFKLFSYRGFAAASVAASVRTIGMSSVGFVVPLYLVDVFSMSPGAIGGVFMLSSAAVVVSLQVGGHMADRSGSWLPVSLGFAGQVIALGTLALLPAAADLAYVVGLIFFNGMAAGLTLAPLHRAALRNIPADQTGAAAGLYSMIRFSGMIIGPPVVAVLLEASVQSPVPTVEAYTRSFWFMCSAAMVGLTMMLLLRIFSVRR